MQILNRSLKKLITPKKILITAGPTWVAIDSARVISNIATGQTGFILAKECKKLGAQVTLLLGPGSFYQKITGIKIINFKYFTQLKQLLKNELKTGKYSAIIHAAAVSDYQLPTTIKDKISSQLKNLKLNLVPTEKLIYSLKKYAPTLIRVGFKFEPQATKEMLIKKAVALLKTADLNLVVANSNKKSGYQAYILDGKNKWGPILSKQKMASKLIKLLDKNYD